MTKHIRKEHPAEPVHDDLDAGYSDAEASEDEQEENDAEEYPEDRKDIYTDTDSNPELPSSRPPSNYHASLWRLPAQTAQRPCPLRLQRPFIPRSDATAQEIKLERCSATPQRSLTDPYPNGQIHCRTTTVPDNISISTTLPQTLPNGALPQQYQLGSRESNVDLWNSQQAMQDSPTSLNGSSPSSAGIRSHSHFPSQNYQHQNTDVPPHDQGHYANNQDATVLNSVHQPMADMTVHDIILDQPPHEYRNVSQTPVQQQTYDNVRPHNSQQELYTELSRNSSRQLPYDGPERAASQTAATRFQDDAPSTPAPTQQLPHYTTSMPEAPYQPPQFLPLESFSISNQYFPPNGGVYQYNDSSLDWWKEIKPEEETWQQLPSQRMQGFGWP